MTNSVSDARAAAERTIFFHETRRVDNPGSLPFTTFDEELNDIKFAGAVVLAESGKGKNL